MNEGWRCPQCGKVNAPWVQQCPCSNLERYLSPIIHGDGTGMPLPPMFEVECEVEKD